jgi:hypothetical protein
MERVLESFDLNYFLNIRIQVLQVDGFLDFFAEIFEVKLFQVYFIDFQLNLFYILDS